MNIAEFFPIWNELAPSERDAMMRAASARCISAGTRIHSVGDECAGLVGMRGGQLRAFINSAEGKEITLYRLFERDLCLMSASCMVSGLQLDLAIEAEKDSEIWVVPPEVYKSVMDRSAALANYTNRIMAERFSEVVWRIEQIMWARFDRRLSQFLLEEAAIEGESEIHITHEKIANHLGTAREVVTRMLRYFQTEGAVQLSRGVIRLLDEKRLRELAE
jgi:CRP/FNR family transcriptional regulator